jgi:cell division protein FtsX
MFLLSRGAARARETSVRVALGASRGQLARQLLMDSALVAAIGGALGMLLAMWTADLVPAFLFEEDAERLVFLPDVLGIAAASAVCAAVAAVCGLMPLVEVRHDDPAAVLRRESAGPSRTMRRVRAGMVAGQMACCCVLVIATGLLLSGFREAVQTDRGERLGPSVLATVEPRSALTRGDLALEYYEAIGRAGQSVPRVASTGWAWRLPNSQPVWQTLRIERQDAPRREVLLNAVTFTPDELSRIQVPPLHGRMFSGEDTAQACRVAIVNEAAARTHFGGDAVGRAIVDEAGARLEVIGIVAMQEDYAAAPPTIYYYGPQNDSIERTGPTRFRVPGWSDEPRAVVDVNSASASYFSIMGFRTTDGVLYPGHPAPGECRTAVANTEAATQHFGGHAVGAAVIDSAGRRTEIVGVVESPVIRTSQRRPEPSIFFPVAQDVRPRMSLVLAARDVDDQLVSAVRRSLEPVPGGAKAPSVETFERYLIRTALASERISTVLVGGYALTALLLGILGLQGAMSDAIRQRRRELAVRVALGAQRWRVVRQIFLEGLRLAALGTTAGMIAALLAARWLARVVPSAAAPGPWVWMGAALALLVAVTIASVLPARRALAVAPLSVMRAD